VCVCVYIYIYTVYTNILYTCIYTHTHTHTHTQTQTKCNKQDMYETNKAKQTNEHSVKQIISISHGAAQNC
jgi:hypothetical protein